MDHIDKKVATLSSFFLLTGVFAYLSHCSTQQEGPQDSPPRHSWHSFFTGRVFTSQLSNAYNSLFGTNTWLQNVTNEIYQHTHKFVLFSTDSSSQSTPSTRKSVSSSHPSHKSHLNRTSIGGRGNKGNHVSTQSPSLFSAYAHQRRSINVHHRRQSPGLLLNNTNNNNNNNPGYISHLPFIPDEYQLSSNDPNFFQSTSQHPVFYHEYLLPLADSPTSLAPDPNKLQPIPQFTGPTYSSTPSTTSYPTSSHTYTPHIINHGHQSGFIYGGNDLDTHSQPINPNQQLTGQGQQLYYVTAATPLSVNLHNPTPRGYHASSHHQPTYPTPNNLPSQYNTLNYHTTQQQQQQQQQQQLNDIQSQPSLPSPSSDYISDLASIYGIDDKASLSSHNLGIGGLTDFRGVNNNNFLNSSFDFGSTTHLLGMASSQPPTPQKVKHHGYHDRSERFNTETAQFPHQTRQNPNDLNQYSTPQHRPLPYPTPKTGTGINQQQFSSHLPHQPPILPQNCTNPQHQSNLGLSGISTDSTNRRRSNSISVSPGIPLIQQNQQSTATTVNPPSTTSNTNDNVVHVSYHDENGPGSTDSPLTTNSRPATTIYQPHAHAPIAKDIRTTLSAQNDGENSQYVTPNKGKSHHPPVSTFPTPSHPTLTMSLPQPAKPLTAAERLNGFGSTPNGHRGNVDMSLFNDE